MRPPGHLTNFSITSDKIKLAESEPICFRFGRGPIIYFWRCVWCFKASDGGASIPNKHNKKSLGSHKREAHAWQGRHAHSERLNVRKVLQAVDQAFRDDVMEHIRCRPRRSEDGKQIPDIIDEKPRNPRSGSQPSWPIRRDHAECHTHENLA